MNFKIDENLPSEYATLLRAAGFQADTVSEEMLSGADDETVADRIRAEGRILITLDLDFANLRAYPPGAFPGIVVFRSKAQDKRTLIALLERLIPVLSHKSPAQQLWVVEPDRVRYREG